jgi:transcriptional regulator with XRE-family HTH domain
MDLCAEIAAARRENGLSQQELASRLGITREKLARLELGSGKVELVLRVMNCIPVRLSGVARGDTLIEQLHNSRLRVGSMSMTSLP